MICPTERVKTQRKQASLFFDQREDQQEAGAAGHGQRQVMVKQALPKGTSIHPSEARVQ